MERHDDENLYSHKYRDVPQGVTDYNDLTNKPRFNDVELVGNVTSEDTHVANESDIPTQVSQLENDAGYITSEQVPHQLSAFTNDVGYITQADIPTKTSDLVNDSGFITEANIPTKTSDLVNDSGFVTSSQMPTATSQLTNDSGFITLSDIPTIPTKTSELTNDSGFITQSDVPTKTSQLTNDSNFVNTTQLATKQDKIKFININTSTDGAGVFVVSQLSFTDTIVGIRNTNGGSGSLVFLPYTTGSNSWAVAVKNSTNMSAVTNTTIKCAVYYV